MLIFITLIWFMAGFAVARYLLQQHVWFTLLPLSLASGIILQTLLLNLLLYPVDAVTGYWLSVLFLMLIAAGGYFWKRDTVPPLIPGASGRQFLLAYGTLLFIHAWVLPALIRFEYIDQKWHHPLAATIASGGLPVRLYTNPAYCTFYHYAPDLLGGVIFRVSGVSMATAFDWMNAWAVLAVMGLALNLAWRLSRRRLMAVGILGMALFVFYGHASWLQFPFLHQTIREATADSPAFAYFHYRTDPDVMRPDFFNFGFPFARASFVQPYSRNLHSHTVNIAWLCCLSVAILLLDRKPGAPCTSSVWFTGGLFLGLMPLASETLWPVPMVAAGLYWLYLFFAEPLNQRRLVAHGTLLFVPALLLGVFQGGTLTDQLFCQHIGLTTEGKNISAVEFPAGPGYYTRIPDDGYISLANPANWPRWIEEWGILILLIPFLLYHYRKFPSALCLMTAVLLPVIGLLFVNFEVIVFDSARVAAVPMALLALMAADWLDWQWQHRRRVLAILLAVGMSFNGVIMLYGQATYDPARSHETDFIYAQDSWLAPIDEQVQHTWFGKIGERDALILDMGYSEWHNYVRPGMVFGHYTLHHVSRARLSVSLPYIRVLHSYPHPTALQTLGFEFVYVDEIWWQNAPPEAIALLENPSNFEEVFTVRRDNQFRRLYRVLPQDRSQYWILLPDDLLINFSW